MANIIRFGGGAGGGLAIEIVGGTTQPASPKDNTIWVNTDVDLGLVYLTPNTPENPEVGDVWVNIGNKFNADGVVATGRDVIVSESPMLKISLMTIQQYNGTAWAFVKNSVYLNGAWQDGCFVLYNNGVAALTPFREGYTVSGGTRSSPFSNVIDYDVSVQFSMQFGAQIAVMVQSPFVDVTPFTRCVITRTLSGSHNSSSFWFTGISQTPITTAHSINTSGASWIGESLNSSTTATTVDMDISSYTGEWMVCVAVANGSASSNYIINDISFYA